MKEYLLYGSFGMKFKDETGDGNQKKSAYAGWRWTVGWGTQEWVNGSVA